MEEAEELRSLRTAHRKQGGGETKPRKQTELKTSHCTFLTAFSPSTAGHTRRLATREVGSARWGTWNIDE